MRLATLILFTLVATVALAQSNMNPVEWVEGPTTCQLGDVAEIVVPEGFIFTDGDGARALLEYSGNLTSGAELGVVAPASEDENWWVFFEFDPMGYVKDTDRNKLDADALFKTLDEHNERANKERRKRGWEELHLTGWQVPPYYDVETNNLCWGLVLTSQTNTSVNFSTRLLGRRGTMNADLVMGPEEFDAAMPMYNALLGGFSYTQGNRYSEFVKGDRVSEIGLTALIAGGAGAVAMKTGLLARFWKLIVGGLMAVGAFLKRIFGGKSKDDGAEETVLIAEPVEDDDTASETTDRD